LISADAREGNDDSGRHKGITKTTIALGNEDENPEMVLLTASNKSIPNLKLDAEYVGVNGFVNTAIAEANYKIKINDTWSLTPGVRYLSQMDDGAGRIGGAALANTFRIGQAASAAKRATYTDTNNADGSILMTRLVLDGGPLKLTAGYSKVSDDADIIAPWRGFPTGGYTRLMAQVDWVANTKNWMVRADYDFGKAGLIPGFKAMVGHENMNFDDNKVAQATIDFTDRTITQIDLWQTFKSLPNTEFRFRVGLVDADAKPAAINTESYNEYRIEMNYLF
jgi:predicted porin